MSGRREATAAGLAHSAGRKVFVLSSGRTGTRFLGERLGPLLGDAISVHEPDKIRFNDRALLRQKLRRQGPWELFVLKGLGVLGSRNLSLARLAGRLEPDEALRRLLRERRWVPPTPLYLEANSQLFGLCDVLLSLPDAHVLVIVRDPRDWVRSWMNKGEWYDERDLLSRVDGLGFKRLAPRHVGLVVPEWEDFSRFQKLCWAWSFINGGFRAQLDAAPPELAWQAFEPLFGQHAPEAVAELLRFVLGREPEPLLHRRVMHALRERVNEGPDAGFPHWRNWPEARRRELEVLCGDLMRRFGYGDEPEWRAGLG